MTQEETSGSGPKGAGRVPESSRIIVKNLPRRITEERIRQHFGAKGVVTDVRVPKTPYLTTISFYFIDLRCRQGALRGFAYVGFSSGKEAKAAVDFFNRTFIDTSRIQVDLALAAGDPNLPRPWSKYSVGSSGYSGPLKTEEAAKQRQESEAKRKAAEEAEKKRAFLMSIYGADEDADAQKYLAAMKTKGKTRTWENDDEAFDVEDSLVKKQQKQAKKMKANIKVDAVPSRKAGANGSMVSQVHITFDSDASENEDEYEEMELGLEGEEKAAQAERIAQKIKQQDKKQKVEKVEAEPAESKPELSPELIAENGRLFVRNLSYSCTEEDLTRLFEVFGPLTQVHMPIARETKKPKGFAYILFMIPEHAVKAYSQLDGTIFQGRLLHILPALDEQEKKKESTVAGQSGYRAKKEEERKADAGKDYNWNSLFIRSDTILDAIAAHLGVPKGEIMDARSDSLATRLAVAETHLIEATKAYLEAEGVALDAFNKPPSERSTTVILAKNLPFTTEAVEIRKLFAKYGNLGRVILPPTTKAIAMVEFLEAAEARAAFRGLAYTKFHSAPLYLEWAPMNALAEKQADSVAAEVAPVVVPPRAAEVVSSASIDDAADEMTAASHFTLYVTNLNFSTQPDTLTQVFAAAGPVKSVKIPTKKAANGSALSLGFGFVEFERKETLNRALDTLQGVVVDDHALVLKRASSATTSPATAKSTRRKGKTAGDDEEDPEATKLIVRNVPFEATERELKDLFRSFAQLKRLRLPKKFDGQHRGFAFADFLTHAEAKRALASLAHTHFYGRHLVLEWAKSEGADDDGSDGEGEAVKEARAKAKRSIGAVEAAASGRHSKGRTKEDRVTFEGDQDPYA
jgi:multiple RNA-binding domain-containing protein 1